jgi:hypothetical protein
MDRDPALFFDSPDSLDSPDSPDSSDSSDSIPLYSEIECECSSSKTTPQPDAG